MDGEGEGVGRGLSLHAGEGEGRFIEAGKRGRALIGLHHGAFRGLLHSSDIVSSPRTGCPPDPHFALDVHPHPP